MVISRTEILRQYFEFGIADAALPAPGSELARAEYSVGKSTT